MTSRRRYCVRALFLSLNTGLVLSGLSLLTFGCVIRFSKHTVDILLSDLYDSFRENVKDWGSNVDMSEFHAGDLISILTIFFITFGACLVTIGTIGWIGAFFNKRKLLIQYIVLMILMFLIEVAIVAILVVLKNVVFEWLIGPVSESLRESYTGFDGDDGETVALNFVMFHFQCCGLYNYTEFTLAKKWNKQSESGSVKQLPVTCCKSPGDYSCTSNPTTINSYRDKGCVEAVEMFLLDNIGILIGVATVLVIVEILLIILACMVVCRRTNKEEDVFFFVDTISTNSFSNSNTDSVIIEPPCYANLSQ